MSLVKNSGSGTGTPRVYVLARGRDVPARYARLLERRLHAQHGYGVAQSVSEADVVCVSDEIDGDSLHTALRGTGFSPKRTAVVSLEWARRSLESAQRISWKEFAWERTSSRKRPALDDFISEDFPAAFRSNAVALMKLCAARDEQVRKVVKKVPKRYRKAVRAIMELES